MEWGGRWERGMGRRVLVEAEDGDMAPSSDQTVNGSPPPNPNLLLPAPLCLSKKGGLIPKG